MIKSILFILSSFFMFQAHADIIKCEYTEPFYTTTYSMAQQSLTIDEFDGTKTVIKNVSFQIVGVGIFELWNANKKVLQTMVHDFNGSDGMSDYIFPYSGTATNRLTGRGNEYGGCTSNFQHKELPAN